MYAMWSIPLYTSSYRSTTVHLFNYSEVIWFTLPSLTLCSPNGSMKANSTDATSDSQFHYLGWHNKYCPWYELAIYSKAIWILLTDSVLKTAVVMLLLTLDCIITSSQKLCLKAVITKHAVTIQTFAERYWTVIVVVFTSRYGLHLYLFHTTTVFFSRSHQRHEDWCSLP